MSDPVVIGAVITSASINAIYFTSSIFKRIWRYIRNKFYATVSISKLENQALFMRLCSILHDKSMELRHKRCISFQIVNRLVVYSIPTPEYQVTMECNGVSVYLKTLSFDGIHTDGFEVSCRKVEYLQDFIYTVMKEVKPAIDTDVLESYNTRSVSLDPIVVSSTGYGSVPLTDKTPLLNKKEA